MKIFLAKTFFRSGDIEFNYKKIIDIYDKSLKENCDLLIFSEMSITGFPIYDLILNLSFVKKTNEYIEKIVDYTKNKKTRILLGCPYSMEPYEKDNIIKKSQIFNSSILIGDGYINAVNSKTNILKNNLFDEYKYFDKEFILKNMTYENDNFDMLIADDIMENKNILFIKERDTDFIICVDTEIQKNILTKKKQLIKIAKWSNKNVIYLNNLGYDLKNKYFFNGDIFLINKLGEVLYHNNSKYEDIIKFETSIIIGELKFSLMNLENKKNENFVNIIAENYFDKNIVFEISDEKNNIKSQNNLTLVTFDKKFESDQIKFIDYKIYIKNLELNKEVKNIIIKNLYDNCIFL